MPIIKVLADEDTYNDEVAPTTNYNTGPEIRTLKFVGLNRHGFIRLNLTPLLPPGATIISCKYHMYIKGGSVDTTPINFHECTQPAAVFSELTWNDYKIGSPWTTPGGDKGSLKGTSTAAILGAWCSVDLTTYAKDQFAAGNPMFLIASIDITSDEKRWYSNDYFIPSLVAYFEINYTIPNLSALGRFRLGYAQLGAALGSISHIESIKATELIENRIYTFLSEGIECQDTHWSGMITSLAEGIEMLQEFLWYPVLDEVGVQVRIVQPVDITMDDFCQYVYEAGHSILVNDANARAFVEVQQREQTFRGNVKVFAGDAVMFSCPTLDIAIGDIIFHDFLEYTIVEIHRVLIGGNYIYFKSALRLKTLPITMPKVTGLRASDNETGTVVLTWDDVNRTLYPSFDHFEIWRAGLHPIIGVNQGLKTFTIDGEFAAFFVEGETFTVSGSTGKDGTYTIVDSSESAGATTVEVAEAIPSAIADGYLNIATFKTIGMTKTASFTDKNLTPKDSYYYVVRAIDKYGNAGAFSEAVATSGDYAKPSTPEGFR